MPVSRPLAALLGAGFIGIAAIGAGAGATFTTSTASQQTITAGTIGMSLSSPDVPGCKTAAQHCQSLALPAVGPVGSTFETAVMQVTMTNTGNIPTKFADIQMSETHGSSAASVALRNQMNVCIKSYDPSGAGPWVEGNGPLTTAVALHPTVVENQVVMQPGDSTTYWVTFYAGQDSSCGTTHSDGPHTRSAWYAAAGAYVTPPSLTNAAMGGSVTPKLTWSFTG